MLAIIGAATSILNTTSGVRTFGISLFAAFILLAVVVHFVRGSKKSAT